MSSHWIPEKIALAVSQLDLSLQVYLVPEIEALLSKTVLFRGKKFRPTLCFLMGQMFGVPLQVLQPYARAAEFVHAATLAHDDVIDESLTRRNRPTLNAKANNARAVLAGDLLLARVMSELSLIGKIEMIRNLAFTVEQLVHGEWLQLEARKVIAIDRAHLETVALKKTASLMVWCCGTAAELGGCNPRQIKLAESFAEYLGLAFQMIDDILDYEPDGEKPFAQDLKEGLVNFLTLEMLEQVPSLREPIGNLLGNVDQQQQQWPWTDQNLLDAKNRVRKRAEVKLEAASLILDELVLSAQDPESERAFRSILLYLRDRVR